MPIFLIHGFKWARTPIREHVIIHNVNDAAPDYLMQATTPAALRASLTKVYPNIMKRIPDIHFIEQYDPEDEGPNARCQPHAFVADKVIRSDLSINVREAQDSNPVSTTAWEALVDLKEALAGKKAELGWYVVYNGDVERSGFQMLADEQGSEEAEAEASNVVMVALETSDANDQQTEQAAQTDTKKGKSGFIKRLMKKDSGKSKASAVTKGSSRTKDTS